MNNYLKLLDLMHQFKSLNIWEYIDSRDIFQVSLSDQDVFISILGHAGIEYGMMVYESVDELSYQIMSENDSLDVEQPDLPFHLSGLKIECRDGKMMSKYDTSGKIFEYDIDDECIALKFNVGTPMRLVNDQECLLLIELLEFFIKYFNDIKKLDFIDLEPTETYLLKDKHSLQIDIIPFPEVIVPHYNVNYEFDKDMLDEVSSLPREDDWAIGIFYSSAFIEDDEQPFFPKICIIYNITQGRVLDLLIPYNDEYEFFPSMLLETFIRVGSLPDYLYIANYETLCYFASLLDICIIEGEVKMTKELSVIYDGMSKELAEDLQEDNLVS